MKEKEIDFGYDEGVTEMPNKTAAYSDLPKGAPNFKHFNSLYDGVRSINRSIDIDIELSENMDQNVLEELILDSLCGGVGDSVKEFKKIGYNHLVHLWRDDVMGKAQYRVGLSTILISPARLTQLLEKESAYDLMRTNGFVSVIPMPGILENSFNFPEEPEGSIDENN